MKRSLKAGPIVLALLVAACTGSTSGESNANGTAAGSGAPVHLVMWIGYTPPPPVNTSQEYLSIQDMVKAFEKQHPNITIDLQYVNSDYALQKATVAIQGNKQPDISYQYGTNMPQLAQSPALVDLTDRVNAGGYNFNDFFPGERAVATVDGKVLGVPALVDNLAVVYNRDLFAKAGLKPPGPDWTWSELDPDAGKSENLFNSNKIGMIITGPWDLSSFPDVRYGVQIMPSFESGGSHETIAGPDNWVVFDNGPDQVNAAWAFVSYMTGPQQVLQDSMRTGHLPTRQSVVKEPGFVQKFNAKFPGEGTFAENLKNVTKARPQIPQYPRVSTALGQAVVSAIQGKASPQDALNQAAQQANGFLAVPA